MTLLIAAALAASSAQAAVQPAPAAAPAQHAQHAQHHGQQAQAGAKPQGKDCCCKTMAEGGQMACCAEHGKGHGGEHAEHGAKR